MSHGSNMASIVEYQKPKSTMAAELLKADQQPDEKVQSASKERVAQSIQKLNEAMVPMAAANKMTQKLHKQFAEIKRELQSTMRSDEKSAVSEPSIAANEMLSEYEKGAPHYQADAAPNYEEAANDILLADENLPGYKEEPQEALPSYKGFEASPPTYRQSIDAKTWSNPEKNTFSAKSIYADSRNGFAANKTSFQKSLSQENIFDRIQNAFEELRNLQQTLLSGYVADLERGTKLGTELTRYSKYLAAKYMELQGQPEDKPENGGIPTRKTFDWENDQSAKSFMNELMAFLRQHNITINKVSLDEWIQPKTDDNPNGGVKEKGKLTESELFFLSETLKNEAQGRSDFNVQLQTRVTSCSQTFSNYQDGLNNIITMMSRLLRGIFEALRG